MFKEEASIHYLHKYSNRRHWVRQQLPDPAACSRRWDQSIHEGDRTRTPTPTCTRLVTPYKADTRAHILYSLDKYLLSELQLPPLLAIKLSVMQHLHRELNSAW